MLQQPVAHIQLCCDGQTLDDAEKLEELCEIYAEGSLEYARGNGKRIVVNGKYLSGLVGFVIDADELEHIALIIELEVNALTVGELLDKICLVADLFLIALNIGEQGPDGVNSLTNICPHVYITDDAVSDFRIN